ncbi:MAG: enterotoxin [Rudaea sp.]|uniref:enterotoxin n=1 Tax=unclassified Rudaea TaxID=2627037 RepID=UPI0010F78E23|nr:MULTISPECIES: enterotoxin [unclassified Rudaea]MBN8884776.1 enterotoxin [Rudaea sp.]
MKFFIALALFSVASVAAAADDFHPIWLPSDPGKAQCRIDKSGGELANAALRFAVTNESGALRLLAFDNRFDGTAHKLEGELFTLVLRDKTVVSASRFKLQGKLACIALKAEPKSSRAASRFAGVALKADLIDAATGLTVHWQAVLRDGGNYFRQEFAFDSNKDVDVARITLVDQHLGDAWTAGTVAGSPVISDTRFFGVEHPMSEARIEAGHAQVFVKRVLPLRANVAVTYSTVFGVSVPGQLRRTFLAYLERERAHPYRTFLHYNSWYDIGYFTPYTQDDATHAIGAYAEKLGKQRGVKLDSFLFDDGWDDHKKLWQFNSGFPDGFTSVAKAAEAAGAEPGVWLSPWGGYGPPRAERLATARAQGYEVDDQGLALSGPKYYKLFHQAALDLLSKYRINQFKLDGTGSPDKVTKGSELDSDFAAAIALIGDLRAVKPDLFINLTTGTWPSPFWLRTADSIWRGGEDHEFAGRGDDRQRWITYRDADTYGGIVRQGPLFPLNSLMLHGIVYARHARGLNVNPKPSDFADEVRSYFASGTGLQEMYISPDLLSDADWDVLADAAKWARERADTLRDSHWIGGDPARGEVYGWASWSPQRAVIALRNPRETAQDFELDLSAVLELPPKAAARFRAQSPYVQGEARELDAAAPARIRLEPFQVLVWDLTPKP